jgi:hypothetical protein
MRKRAVGWMLIVDRFDMSGDAGGPQVYALPRP